MKKLFLFFLILSFYLETSYAQPFVGIKMGTDVGVEAGFTIADKFSVKAFSFTDFTSTKLFFVGKDDNPYEGNRYNLSYGIGAGMRIAGPFWLILDVGYGWSGKYTLDPVYASRARKDNVQGFEFGVEAQWDFGDLLYISGGYFTVPNGFSKGRPVNCIMVTAGLRF